MTTVDHDISEGLENIDKEKGGTGRSVKDEAPSAESPPCNIADCSLKIPTNSSPLTDRCNSSVSLCGSSEGTEGKPTEQCSGICAKPAPVPCGSLFKWATRSVTEEECVTSKGKGEDANMRDGQQPLGLRASKRPQSLATRLDMSLSQLTFTNSNNSQRPSLKQRFNALSSMQSPTEARSAEGFEDCDSKSRHSASLALSYPTDAFDSALLQPLTRPAPASELNLSHDSLNSADDSRRGAASKMATSGQEDTNRLISRGDGESFYLSDLNAGQTEPNSLDSWSRNEQHLQRMHLKRALQSTDNHGAAADGNTGWEPRSTRQHFNNFLLQEKARRVSLQLAQEADQLVHQRATDNIMHRAQEFHAAICSDYLSPSGDSPAFARLRSTTATKTTSSSATTIAAWWNCLMVAMAWTRPGIIIRCHCINSATARKMKRNWTTRIYSGKLKWNSSRLYGGRIPVGGLRRGSSCTFGATLHFYIDRKLV